MGFIRSDDNMKTNYQARELCSVEITTPNVCAKSKLTLYECYVNRANMFNQVGLISFSIFGSPLVASGSVPGFCLTALCVWNLAVCTLLGAHLANDTTTGKLSQGVKGNLP
jgi:hypothetical protein